MLSNTAETKPSPNAVCHDAGGSSSTGIIDAASTSDSRKIVPFIEAGTSLQSGRRTWPPMNIAVQTATPMNGKRSAISLKKRLTVTFTAMAPARMNATTASDHPSMRTPDSASFRIGCNACCWRAAMTPKMSSATTEAMYASTTTRGEIPEIHIIVVVVSPTTLPDPPALDAATMPAR